MNCPVCDKSGLPDYTLNPATCPQCNSDLSGFLVIEKGRNKFYQIINRQMWLLGLIAFLIIVLGVLIVKRPNLSENNALILSKDSTIVNLNSELQQKELVIQEIKETANHKSEIEFKYIVKKGDNLSKIAYIFFNDWEMYKKIQEDNDLKPNEYILPNDTLTIKIKSDSWKR